VDSAASPATLHWSRLLQSGYGVVAVETGTSSTRRQSAGNQLHLGHGVAAVETSVSRSAFARQVLLHLGHGVAAVETARPQIVAFAGFCSCVRER
jgi:hypothetical protein